MNILSRVGNWIVLSSKDPQKFSMTIKGVLLGAITLLATFGIDTSALPQGVDFLVDVAEKVLLAISSAVTFIGFVRKVYTSYKGTNAVVNNDFR